MRFSRRSKDALESASEALRTCKTRSSDKQGHWTVVSRLRLFFLIAVFTSLFPACRPGSDPAPVPAVKPTEVAYDVQEVRRKNLEHTVSLLGSLIPAVRKDLHFRYSGKLTQSNVSFGAPVKRGDLLAEIHVPGLTDQIEQQQILFRLAELRLAGQRSLGANRYELRLAGLELKRSELQLALLTDQQEATKLIAPFDGIIVSVFVRPSSYVEAYQEIMTIVDPSKLVLECRGQDTEHFRFGMHVEVEIKHERYAATVIYSPEYAPRDRQEAPQSVVFAVANLPADTAMNSSAVAYLTIAKQANAIVVNKNLLHFQEDQPYVRVLKNGLVEDRDVVLGMQTRIEVQIVRGLEEGELLVTRRR